MRKLTVVNSEDVEEQTDPRTVTPEKSSFKLLLHPKTAPIKQHIVGLHILEPRGIGGPNIHPESEESFYFIRGKGVFIVEDEEQEVRAGSSVFFPRNVLHGMVNTGDEPILALLVLAPPETPEAQKRGKEILRKRAQDVEKFRARLADKLKNRSNARAS